MCGIVGLYNFKEREVAKEILAEMAKTMSHRGPDYGSIWYNNNVGLGHQLLKIQDLSDKSNQPVQYKDYVMIYNGEVYNFAEIKSELLANGYEFFSKGDTEVVIKAFDQWGLDAIKKFNGFFAIALYNLKTTELYIIRDRFGIKPLHYTLTGDELIFASEIKVLFKHPKVQKKVDLNTVGVALACRLWMPPDRTFFDGIFTLEPGTYLKCTIEGIEKVEYYEMKFTNTLTDEKECVKGFRIHLENSIKRRLLSQVPVAAFLSGGIDSSFICKYANDLREGNLNTFTIFYNNDNDLDLNHAKEFTDQEKNIQAYNILIEPKHYEIESLDKVIYSMEELLIDKVYVSVYYNYKAAKENGFTVVLNGQGSDEAWLGYIHTWNIFKQVNLNVNTGYLVNDYYIPQMILGDKIKEQYLLGFREALKQHLEHNFVRYINDDIQNTCSIFAIRSILHNLLLQEDKLSMAHSVEARVPYVDHELIEFALSIPSSLKTKDGREKYILRKAGEGLLPDSILNRYKYPFPEPPNIYNSKIKDICEVNWENIKKSLIISMLIQEKWLGSINNFSDLELWWILVIWRFEKVFALEG